MACILRVLAWHTVSPYARRMPRARPKPNATPDDLTFGVNSCEMALRFGAVKSLLYAREARNPRVLRLVELAREAGLRADPVDPYRLDELTGGGVHQGILARVNEPEPVDLRAIAKSGKERSLVLLLDGVTDPQNLGAVLRTAVAVSVDAVVLPRRRGAQLTPGVHRASAGLSFIAPVASPANLAQALDLLKEHNYWAVAAGAAPDAGDATSFEWPAKTALVVGSEGEGVSHLLGQLADFHVALPMDPRVESLNVGVATGALAYLFRRQWPATAG